jgi:hypothetical protein
MKMIRVVFLLFFISCACSWSVNNVKSGIGLYVNITGGSFQLAVDNDLWLAGGDHTVRADGRIVLLSKALSSEQIIASDVFGSFIGMRLTYQLSQQSTVVTTYKVYNDIPAVMFEQYFPNGATGTNSSGGFDDLATSFPRIYAKAGKVPDLGYVTFKAFWDLYCQGGPGFDAELGTGMYGNVPLMLYNRDTLRNVIIAPANNFKVAFQSRTKDLAGDLGCGVHGVVASLPAHYTHQTLIMAGEGINNGFERWGDLLLRRYGKQRYDTTNTNDIFRSKLGYNTNTGGFYWYNTEPGMNYEETILSVKKYHVSIGVPVRYYELDSWWYYKEHNSTGEHGGIKFYEPRPDIFPNGLNYVQQKLSTPLVVHHKVNLQFFSFLFLIVLRT